MQLGNDEVDDVDERLGHHRVGEVEAVEVARRLPQASSSSAMRWGPPTSTGPPPPSPTRCAMVSMFASCWIAAGVKATAATGWHCCWRRSPRRTPGRRSRCRSSRTTRVNAPVRAHVRAALLVLLLRFAVVGAVITVAARRRGCRTGRVRLRRERAQLGDVCRGLGPGIPSDEHALGVLRGERPPFGEAPAW